MTSTQLLVHDGAVARGGRLSRLYLSVWAALAGLALAYLAVVALRPELADMLVGGQSATARDGSRSQQAMSGTAEMNELREAVRRLQGELQEMRDLAAARDMREQSTMARLGALEAIATARDKGTETPAPQNAALAQAESRTASGAGGERAGSLSGTTVQGTVDDRPPAKPAPRLANVSTSALPASKSVPSAAVQIGTGPSLDSLRLSWALLQENHRTTLKSLEPRYVDLPGDVGSYGLIAGPLASPDAATKVCERLKARRIPCAVTQFGGQPL